VVYAFRAASTAGNANGNNLTVTKPTGTADGDLLVVSAYLENATNTWSSVGAGFNALTRATNTAGFSMQRFWKIAASEPASWTWSPNTAGWRTVVVAAYSGATATGGNQVDVEGTAASANAATTLTITGVTTTAADDLGVVACANFQGSVSGETGFATNERVDFGGVMLSDAQKATAGATGNTVVNAGTSDYLGRLITFFLSAPGGAATTAPPPFRHPYRFFRKRG
jgi:hypothetical protein